MELSIYIKKLLRASKYTTQNILKNKSQTSESGPKIKTKIITKYMLWPPTLLAVEILRFRGAGALNQNVFLYHRVSRSERFIRGIVFFHRFATPSNWYLLRKLNIPSLMLICFDRSRDTKKFFLSVVSDPRVLMSF